MNKIIVNLPDDTMHFGDTVTEIVFCDYCKNLDAGANESECWYQCKWLKKDVYPSFFCGHGERRIDDEDSR